MTKYEVIVVYRIPVTVEAEDEQAARADAYNQGAEAILHGGTFLQQPAIESVKEVE